ncbi:hypothetical protein ACFYRC_34580 [Streptomyces sp. NPDC005279]|uniref:hypothetical protein n=1 Tax=Streptomyces sp. NPDC005279 TaxID=3364712 RepID=UPI00367DA205
MQISILRLRRAVLTAAAQREPTPKEMELMHQLATLSEAERRRLIDDFLDTLFEGLHSGTHHAAARRSMTPELPNNPTDDRCVPPARRHPHATTPGHGRRRP